MIDSTPAAIASDVHARQARWPRQLTATLVWAASLAVQFLWLHHHLGARPALLHLIPGSLTLAGVMALSALTWRHAAPRWIVFACYNLLALRPAVTLGSSLAWLQWGAFLILALIVLLTVMRRFSAEGSGRWFALALGLVVLNSFGHLALESPFTHTFHLISGLPSDFHGVDNNSTWECGYDGTTWAVHCDARHFIASELIFVDPQYDASFSVVLVRFYAEFLNSLLGSDGLRWQANLAVNMFLWMLSCAAVYRLARLWDLSLPVARAAMLANASAWGFVSLVAQPAPYLAAYVFAIFSFWATASLALENAPHPLRSGALILIMILTAGVYESYPISLACFLVLCFYRRFGAAVLLAAGQITLTLVWKHIGLAQILGTVGYMESASSGASNLSHDIQTWWNIVIGLDFARLLHYLWVGSLAFVFGNVVFGAVAGIGLSVKQWRWFNHTDSKRCFWLMLMLVNSAMFAAMVFIVPQTFHWSPSTGMQPRLAFFSFALNLIAACYWMYTIKPQLVWSIPILSVFIANIDKTGFASIAMLFDYGALGLFWY